MALFTISGVKEIKRAYALLPKRVANKVIRQSIRTAIRPMAAKAKQNAPSGKGKRQGRDSRGRYTATRNTGKTARAIKIRARKGRRRGDIALDVRVGEGDFKGDTFYSAFPEFGTAKQPAQNYMRRAFDETEDESRATAIRLIRDGTLREWKNL